MTLRFIVYGLIDPHTDEVRYIGKSTTGMRRPLIHAAPSVVANDCHTHKGRWIQGLLAVGARYRVTILAELPDAYGLDALEEYWIAYGRAVGWSLTNITSGGEGSVGWSPSAATCAKISATLRGRKIGPFPESHRRNMSRSLVGRVLSDETRAKIGAGNRGKKHTQETRDRMSASRAGKRQTANQREVTRQAVLRSWAKRIICFAWGPL